MLGSSVRERHHLAVPVALLVLAACSGESPTSVNPDPDGDGILAPNDACPNQPETINNVFDGDGCPDTPDDFYEAVRADVEAYWQAALSSQGLTYKPITRFTGYSSSIDTPCGTVEPNNAFYCGVDGGVYYHTPFLDGLLADIGDAAPAFAIAHEIGHHVGFRHLGWFPTLTLSTEESELGADCFAGTWLAWVNARGLLEEGDIQELAATMLAVGDPAWTWFDPTQHGTAQQRAAALDNGFANGAWACLPSPGGLTGYVFYDTNANALWDSGEGGWEGVPVIITDQWGRSRVVATNANGEWTVSGLPIGVAEVNIDESGFTIGIVQTLGTDPDTVLVVANTTYLSGYDGFNSPSLYALDFTSDFVVVPDSPDLDLSTAWTIEAWIKPRDVGPTFKHLVSKWGTCPAASYSMELNGAKLRSGIANCGSGTQVVETPDVVVANQWQHVAITLGNGTLRLYVNGVLQATQTGSIAPINTATNLWLGEQTGGGYAFNGLIDEVRIWNVEQTATDLHTLMKTRLTGAESGLVAYWRLDEGAGDTAFDVTGHGNDGRLGNAVGPDGNDPAWTTDAAPIAH